MDRQPQYAPIAQHLAAHGRNGDSVLVHMTPNELGGLQSLAMAKGGSLSINPHTGLPEASFLENILPMLAGALLTATGVGAPVAAMMVGGGTAAVTGDLQKGLMAGLGAFGGASLGGAMGLGSAGAEAATSAATGAATAGTEAATTAASTAGAAGANAANTGITLAQGAPLSTPAIPSISAANVPQLTASSGGIGALPGAATPSFTPNPSFTAGATNPGALQGAPLTMPNVPAINPATAKMSLGDQFTNFYNRFKGAANAPNADGSMNTANTMRSAAATAGVALPVMNALQPEMKAQPEEDDGFNYNGPYKATERPAQFRNGTTYTPSSGTGMVNPQGAMTGDGIKDTSEFQYFSPVNPFPAYSTAASNTGTTGAGANGALTIEQIRQMYGTGRIPSGFAGGGPVLDHGSFIVDARTVAELGNGSSQAGQELLARLGGQPIKGKGDGVSDSIPASVGGATKAKVARDEVKFSPDAVKRIGGGDIKRGTQKLYDLMAKAQQARKTAERGEDTKLRGLLSI